MSILVVGIVTSQANLRDIDESNHSSQELLQNDEFERRQRRLGSEGRNLAANAALDKGQVMQALAEADGFKTAANEMIKKNGIMDWITGGSRTQHQDTIRMPKDR
ncbi:hypothetical protein PQX77_002765, partial [Marasmius sp. AFHP31]